MRIVWLAGWFPHSQNRASGNFIERHFEAVRSELPPEDSIELWHFAPYNIGNPTPESLKKDSRFIRIIPVKQWGNHLKLWNAFWYYFRVSLHLIQLFTQQRRVDIVHVHAADKIGVIAAWFKKRFAYSLWLTEHWAIFNQPVSDAFHIRSKWFQFGFRYLWSQVDVVASINEHLYREMQGCLGDEKTVIRFPNVLDGHYLNMRSKVSIERSEATWHFLHVSNGESRKNVEPLLEAFKKFHDYYPHATLSLIGSDTFNAMNSIAGVEGFGILPPEELKHFYARSHALILVSDAENAPCVITEALCLGIPVITTLVGGVSEITDQTNSIQIPAFQTHDEKAEKIHNALLEFVTKMQTFDSEQISAAALQQFHPKYVGRTLVNAYANQTCVA